MSVHGSSCLPLMSSSSFAESWPLPFQAWNNENCISKSSPWEKFSRSAMFSSLDTVYVHKKVRSTSKKFCFGRNLCVCVCVCVCGQGLRWILETNKQHISTMFSALFSFILGPAGTLELCHLVALSRSAALMVTAWRNWCHRLFILTHSAPDIHTEAVDGSRHSSAFSFTYLLKRSLKIQVKWYTQIKQMHVRSIGALSSARQHEAKHATLKRLVIFSPTYLPRFPKLPIAYFSWFIQAASSDSPVPCDCSSQQ